MSFKTEYPDYATIEAHIHRARAERAVAVAALVSDAILAARNGLQRFAAFAGAQLAAERDRRAIEADAFLKRSVPKY